MRAQTVTDRSRTTNPVHLLCALRPGDRYTRENGTYPDQEWTESPCTPAENARGSSVFSARKRRTWQRPITLDPSASSARAEEHEGSDVDILVEFSEVPGIFGFLRLEHYLSELLGRKVDLVEKSALKPRISRRIQNEVVYV